MVIKSIMGHGPGLSNMKTVTTTTLWKCPQGGRLRMGVLMMLVCVASMSGSVIPSSLPTATHITQQAQSVRGAVIIVTKVTAPFCASVEKCGNNSQIPIALKLISGKKCGNIKLELDQNTFTKWCRDPDVLLRKHA